MVHVYNFHFILENSVFVSHVVKSRVPFHNKLLNVSFANHSRPPYVQPTKSLSLFLSTFYFMTHEALITKSFTIKFLPHLYRIFSIGSPPLKISLCFTTVDTSYSYFSPTLHLQVQMAPCVYAKNRLNGHLYELQ